MSDKTGNAAETFTEKLIDGQKSGEDAANARQKAIENPTDKNIDNLRNATNKAAGLEEPLLIWARLPTLYQKLECRELLQLPQMMLTL